MERSAILKGLWYPEDRKELDSIVRPDLFRRGNSTDAVLPHAGLFYSGRIIREYFSSLSENIRQVFILSPSHYYLLPENRLTTSRFTSSATPYGSIRTVPVSIEGSVISDEALQREPVSIEGSVISDEALQREHGIEMFLPFIKARKLDVSYALISHVDSLSAVRKIAEELTDTTDEHTGFIASSDFTHYGRRFDYTPYGDDAESRVAENDDRCASLLSSFSLEEVFDKYTSGTICGIAPAMIVSMIASMRKRKGRTGPAYTSNDITGEHSDDFVSYRSVIWEE